MDHSSDPKYDFDPPVGTVQTPANPPQRYGLYSYLEGVKIYRKSNDYYSLIVAAMIGADTENKAKLQAAWPDLCAEVQARWNAPGGKLPSEMA